MLQNLFILIAEDDEDDSAIVSKCFKDHPLFLKVEIVKNGKEVIDYLSDDANVKPDVILTDLNMPFVNGLELLKKIYLNQEFKKISSFAYSSSSSSIYQAKCIDLGAKAFLEKPNNYSDFNEIPKKIIDILTQNL